MICGRGGDDNIHGRKGNDILRGGPGDDSMDGGPGNDVLRGGPGDDVLWSGFGHQGNDRLYGGAGNDRIDGVYEWTPRPPPPPPPPPPPEGEFLVRYLPADEYSNQVLIDWINERNWINHLVRYLNETYSIPNDIHVLVSDNMLGPAYFPGDRKIQMPVEFFSLTANLFSPYWHVDSYEEVALQAFAWVFLHEAGHALIHQLNIPITGLEEDAADQFVTTIMLGLDRPWPVYDAAILFELLGDNRGAVGAEDFWDEHALHEQRATNILCWVYGYDPFQFTFIPNRYTESVDRLENCGYEYQQIKSSWERLLESYLK